MLEIVFPGDDERADYLIASFCHRGRDDRYGPKYRKNVSVMLKKVCDTFMLDPQSVADKVSAGLSDHENRQVAVLRESCLWPSGVSDLQRPLRPAACSGFIHLNNYFDCAYHYKALIFDTTSATEACQKLRKYFEPITTGPKSPSGIVLPDLGDLEDRVGLNKFLKEGI